MPDPTPYTEFGLAGLFAFFAVILLYIFIRHVENINELWRGFLEQERDERKAVIAQQIKARSEAMAEGTHTVADLTEAIGKLAEALGGHDTNAQERHINVLEKLTALEVIMTRRKK